MALNLSESARAALDRAKRCVPDGGELDLGILLPALYQGTQLEERFPELADRLPAYVEQGKETPVEVPVAADLRPVLKWVAEHQSPSLGPEEWFALLLKNETGAEYAARLGIDEDSIQRIVDFAGSSDGAGSPEAGSSRKGATGEASGWRASPERRDLMEALDSFGRMLTTGDPPQKNIVEMDDALQKLVQVLVKRKQSSALVHGEPGTGKSALVYELARRMLTGESPVPAHLRDHDIFELSPVFLRSGASYVGQYDERVGSLLKLLTAHPKVILFVDEVHSLLQSGMHHSSPFSSANEAFKTAINSGDIRMIGATTTAEFRHYIEPEPALMQRFKPVPIRPPSPDATRSIMRARLPEVAEFYGLRVPDAILDQAVDLTEQYLPGRAQPRKTIQLLDDACAYCVTQDPPLEEVPEKALWEALEGYVGHGIIRREGLDAEDVYRRLRERLVGQDDTLRQIAHHVVTGLGGWTGDHDEPRGVFFFCGPTGVGKTEAALLLSRILGGGQESLVRIDCNTLQGSGLDSGPARNALLGPPPGYIGYVRGQGGLLSRIRDMPESVVLFDEIEKADPGVGEIVLRIIDDGECEDNDGNLLDFRRAFIIFTTNAGAVYDDKRIGFGTDGSRDIRARTDMDALRAQIRRMGLGEEFLQRIRLYFVFQGLGPEAVDEILDIQLERLRETARVRGYDLSWDEAVHPHLAALWDPRFGVRQLVSILRSQVVAPVSVADAGGHLKDVDAIRIEVSPPAEGEAAGEAPEPEGTRSERRGKEFVIHLD